MQRPRIPLPPIKDPICDEEDGNDYDWYYGANAGGLTFWFGSFKDYKIHQVPLYYIDWCRQKLTARLSLQSAISPYLEGVTHFAENHYGEFIVPLGKKHKGQTIAQCRDKPWFEWLTQKHDIKNRYPYFIRAVKQWLAYPRRQGLQRDIGELLNATKYEDDLELMDAAELDNDQLTQEDIDFLDDSGLVEGTEGAGNESYQTSSGANTSPEAGDEGNEGDSSLEAVPTNSSDSEEEPRARNRVPSRRTLRVSRSTTRSERVSPTPRRIVKSRFIREAQYSNDSDDSDDVRSFIDDGSIKYEDSVPTAESGPPSPEPPKRIRKRRTKRGGLEDEENSQAGPSSRVLRYNAGKSRGNRQGIVNAASDSDDSDFPEVHSISTPSKSSAKKRKAATRRANRKHSEVETPQVGRASRTLRSATTQSAKTRKSQRVFFSDTNSALGSDSDPPISSPTKARPKRTPKRGKGSQKITNQLSASRGARKRRGAVRSGNVSASASYEESPRAIRRRIRNSRGKAVTKATGSDWSNEELENGETQEDEGSVSGRNEIDNISSEASAEFSTDDEDFSESGHPGSVRRSLYPSPPLTEVTHKRRRKAKTKRRTKNIPDFVVPDEESVDQSDDFQAMSITETSNPHTPEPTTPRCSTRTSPRKATSPEKAAVRMQTPVNRCYVELPPSRQHLSKKKVTPAHIFKDVSLPPRAGTLKRSRNVVMSSEEEPGEETKRPRISPIQLPHQPKARPFHSDEETIDGSVDGETIIRGSSLGLSSPPSKNYGQPSPSKPRARKSVAQIEDNEDVFNKSQEHRHKRKHSQAVQAPYRSRDY